MATGALAAAWAKAQELGLDKTGQYPVALDISDVRQMLEAALGVSLPSEAILEIGPAPAGPPVCFNCLTDVCGHSDRVKASSVHGGGVVPVVTYYKGTGLCSDCAMKAEDT